MTNPIQIVTLGDSITQAASGRNSYRRDLWNSLVNNGYDIDFVGSQNRTRDDTLFPDRTFDPDHEGHWGWRTDEIINGRSGQGNLASWLTSYTPDIALIHLGSNDAFQNNSTESTISELRQVINILRQDNPNIVIFVAELIPTTNNTWNQRVQNLNNQIPQLVSTENRSNSPVILVDQNSGFNAATDTYDGVHPNASGETKMAQRWFEAVRTYLDSTSTLTVYVDTNGIVVGNAYQAGQTYSGELFTNTDGTANPHDIIRGTDGNDNIWAGETGNDHIDAGGGNNTISVGLGNVTVTAGNGDNFIYSIAGGGGTNTINLGNGRNQVWLERGNNTITTGSGNDSIGLGMGIDIVRSSGGNNIIYMVDSAQPAGNKDILTGSGDDYIATGSGDDLIDGGLGLNTLLGGAGYDTFALRVGAYNFIGDFEVGSDALRLTSLSFADLSFYQGTGSVSADAFIFVGSEAIAQIANTTVNQINNVSNFV